MMKNCISIAINAQYDTFPMARETTYSCPIAEQKNMMKDANVFGTFFN